MALKPTMIISPILSVKSLRVILWNTFKNVFSFADNVKLKSGNNKRKSDETEPEKEEVTIREMVSALLRKF